MNSAYVCKSGKSFAYILYHSSILIKYLSCILWSQCQYWNDSSFLWIIQTFTEVFLSDFFMEHVLLNNYLIANISPSCMRFGNICNIHKPHFMHGLSTLSGTEQPSRVRFQSEIILLLSVLCRLPLWSGYGSKLALLMILVPEMLCGCCQKPGNGLEAVCLNVHKPNCLVPCSVFNFDFKGFLALKDTDLWLLIWKPFWKKIDTILGMSMLFCCGICAVLPLGFMCMDWCSRSN